MVRRAAIRDQPARMGGGGIGLEEVAAIGEAVRGDIDDAHQPGAVEGDAAERGARGGDAGQETGEGGIAALLEFGRGQEAPPRRAGLALDQLDGGKGRPAAGQRQGGAGVHRLAGDLAPENADRAEIDLAVHGQAHLSAGGAI